MNCELITIGDELLIGQVIDTNSAFIAQRLNEIGISVTRRTVVGDDADDMIGAISESSMRAKIVIMTGGIGPTKDDLTKDVLCDYFGTSLKFDELSFKNLEELFKLRGKEITELNRNQAMLPENCIPLSNKLGTAPGMWFDHNEKIYVSLPGVPYEMEALIREHVIPKLIERFKLEAIFHKTILTTGLPESILSDRIKDWENNLPSFFKLAYLPAPGMVRLRISGDGGDYKEKEKASENAIEDLKKIIGDNIFGYGDDKLQEVIGDLLNQKKQTISFAESCTGGYVSHLVTSVPGSSSYLKGSVIPYSNEYKTEILNIDAELIKKHGAVSEEVVIKMASNCKSLFKTDYAIGISGIAGPGGGSEEKPVGLVWIGMASPSGITARRFQFGKNRSINIQLTANAALEMLRREMLGIGK